MKPTAVVLAAGAGKRLGELGRRHSKAMLPLAGKPLIEWIVERLVAADIGRVVVVAHASDKELASYFARQSSSVTIVLQAERRGIADALRLALPALLTNEPCLACACDSIFAAEDLAGVCSLGQQFAGAAVVGVLDMGVEATAARSAVEVEDGRVLAIVEKPAPGATTSSLVSLPLYWLPAEFRSHLENRPLQGEHYVSTALSEFIEVGGTVLSYRVRYRLEITMAADVAEVERALRRS